MSLEVAEGAFAFLGKSDAMRDGWGTDQGFIPTKAGVVVIDTIDEEQF
jgi:hypothetical protein